MAKHRSPLLLILACGLVAQASLISGATDEDRKDYIVYLGSLPEGDYSPSSHHRSLLQEITGQSSSGNFLITSYKRSFNGFTAKLTYQEAQELASRKEVVSVFPSRTLRLQTTRSWDFMGFSEALSKSPRFASDIIIGIIDTGIWPESESFSDEGFGSPPKKWKGACDGGTNFTCNNKVIGARYYFRDLQSSRDVVGHGTHTASTAAGNVVEDASLFGLAKGSARGGLPSSRIAVYKVCRSANTCESKALMAAFDDAIADGVDIISISIGSLVAYPFEEDVIAIGAFHAMTKGILTVQSAGNSGPELGVTASVAPWKLSVAASSTDRRLVDRVVLGNGKAFVGYSVNSFSLNGTQFPLIYGKEQYPANCSQEISSICHEKCLHSNLVKGKIVLCDISSEIDGVKKAGAIGTITVTTVPEVSDIASFPESDLSSDDYNAVKSYANSTKSPHGKILKSEAIKDSAAPVVAYFSSRGPNAIAPDVIKPDITAPGVNILAAYSPVASPSDHSDDKSSVKYSLLSGTSVACPHAAGVAAYVKASHPDWSPSAIKSAIMTTAWTLNTTTHPDGELAYGSGHINPVKVIHPGLVYEASEDDYVRFLCSLGYDTKKLRLISGSNISCPSESDKGSPKDLNYPSMAAKISPNQSFEIGFHRTVTNVGLSKSAYKVKIVSSSKLKIKVEPAVLSFKSLKEKKSFNVTVSGAGLAPLTFESASLVWSDGKHSVRSPIVIHTIYNLSS